MITRLQIEHFKSIESLDIECNRINIFIGEPNTGKSNILEALAFFTFYDQIAEGSFEKLSSYIRFKDLSNLFTDGLLDHDVSLKITRNVVIENVILAQPNDERNVITEEIRITPESNNYRSYDRIKMGTETIEKGQFTYNFSGEGSGGGSGNRGNLSSVKYYVFKELPEYTDIKTDSLTPPFGANLVSLIRAHKNLQQKVKDLLKTEGYRLLVKPHDKQIEIIKDSEDISYGYPYVVMSDTLKRIIFYMLAIHSNKNAAIVLEEPESQTFPYYTKHLAEEIALDDENQYFIATHNPYLLRSIIEKAPKIKVNIFVVSTEEYLTKVTKLDSHNVRDLLESDPFFNLSSFIQKGEG
ncbi:AAA family ATPase [Methanoregula sp.]|jgi:AAA15 family ATPase/GTPase|uniref:AAA family ATPase n=1 Tax=Methanoregula sp. TaxID=2052170 RepID=UPI003C70F00E